MPIREERKHLYPKNWPAISAAVRAEAGDRCEQCRIANATVGYRRMDGSFAGVPAIDRPTVERVLRDLRGPVARLTRIVLTVHHRDGDPTNNRRDNLVALCQRCHLSADRALRDGLIDHLIGPAFDISATIAEVEQFMVGEEAKREAKKNARLERARGATIENGGSE